MAKIASKFLITTETHEIIRFLVADDVRNLTGFCERCGSKVEFLSINSPAVLAFMPANVLFRKLNGGEIHYVETENREICICRRSLEEETK